MGKYMNKAKITPGEVTVMDASQSSLGVITRAKTLALQRDSTTHLQKTTPYLQLRSRRLEKPLFSTPKTSILPKTASADAPNPGSKQDTPNPRLGSINSRSGSVTQSCPKTRDAVNEVSKPLSESETAIEASFGENVLDFDSRERNIRETTPSSLVRASETMGTPGSTTRPTNSTATNRIIQRTTRRSVPTTREMEEFFAAAEQQQQRRFTEKYNYDPMNDMPLPGRYEWVRLDS